MIHPKNNSFNDRQAASAAAKKALPGWAGMSLEADAETGDVPTRPADILASTRQGQELARIYTGLDDDRRAALLRVAQAIETPSLARAA